VSFLRPELAARVRPWREAGLWAGVLALGLWLIWRGYAWLDALTFATGMVLAGAGFALLIGAVRRQRLAAARPGPGVVSLDEGRIGYFGPDGGGFLDRDALARVDLVIDPGGARGDAFWRLTAEDGQRLTIPLGAHGAGALYDGLAALPGLQDHVALAALAAGRAGTYPVWQRGR